MAKEFRLDVEGSSFLWRIVNGHGKGLQEIKNDLDALIMGNSIAFNREMYVYIKLENISCVHGEVQTSSVDLLNDVEIVQETKVDRRRSYGG